METKICKECKEEKELIMFTKSSTSKGGYFQTCKKCNNEKRKKFYRTKVGLIKRIYNSQKQTSRKRGFQQPTYTQDWIINWCLSQEIYHKLYEKWVHSEYDKNLTPSIDRINDYIGYTNSNIQIMTTIDNRRKFYKDVLNGKNNKTSKSVVKVMFNRTILEKYHSIAEAVRMNKNTSITSISRCCNGTRESCGGYMWCYEKDLVESNGLAINLKELIKNENKSGIVCLDKDLNIIKEYNRLSDVKYDGFSVSKVCSCCRGRRKTHKSFIWKYKKTLDNK